ncbi:Retrovirus-related Pol polyprotein from transposon [Rhizoctonia solani]|uniref:RNA-directed DNA polymerase n=1 Tax=Rhizoctonia solani TaxID=456999 RepID=A0A8H8NT71_9AGAM|nr:Retrovirus-related Pol polyprotein from transposon [Rhizoctonia solani]QRW17991.1 Retrovirus-related Pol polyprotein from transposon [Rhizoctonia solani]
MPRHSTPRSSVLPRDSIPTDSPNNPFGPTRYSIEQSSPEELVIPQPIQPYESPIKPHASMPALEDPQAGPSSSRRISPHSHKSSSRHSPRLSPLEYEASQEANKLAKPSSSIRKPSPFGNKASSATFQRMIPVFGLPDIEMLEPSSSKPQPSEPMNSHELKRSKGKTSEAHISKHRETQAALLDPNDRSFTNDPAIQKYLPYSPSTTLYPLNEESPGEFNYQPDCTQMTSWCRKNPQANSFRKVYRQLGRVFYHVEIPPAHENCYPSPSCEQWASHYFKLLDTVVTFRPTCCITTKLVPAQEINHWPEYGKLHIDLNKLIKRTVHSVYDMEELLPIPEWPEHDCLFTSHSFEVAAVTYRDQMERFIQKLYEILGRQLQTGPPSPVISAGHLSEVEPGQEHLRDRTLQLKQDMTLLVPKSSRASSVTPQEAAQENLLRSLIKPTSQVTIASPLLPDPQVSPPTVTLHTSSSTPPGQPPSSLHSSKASLTVTMQPRYLGPDNGTSLIPSEPLPPPPSSIATSSSRSIPLGRIPEESPHVTLQVPPTLERTERLRREATKSLGPRPPTPRPTVVPSTSSEETLPSSPRGNASVPIAQPSAIPPFNIQALEDYINNLSDGSIDGLSSSESSTGRDQVAPELIAPATPADSITSVSSAATHTMQIPVAQSTPRIRSQVEEDNVRNIPYNPPLSNAARRVSLAGPSIPLRDPPPHADFINRRSSLGANRRSSGRPAIPAESFTRVSTIPEERSSRLAESAHRRPTSSPESRRTPLSIHTNLPYLQEQPAPVTREEANMSRRGNFLAPLLAPVPQLQVPPAPPIDRTRLPPHIVGRMVSSRRFSELFNDPPPRDQLRDRLAPLAEGGGGNDPPYDSDEGDFDNSGKRRNNPPRRNGGGPPNDPEDPGNEPYAQANAARARPFNPAPVHFDTKLKPDIIPEWDGDTKKLSRWMTSINNIAEYSSYTRIQLGQQIPLRFTGRALRWFNALDKDYRRIITEDWPALRQAITIHFMNRTFLNRSKNEAMRIRFRDKDHSEETPEDYVIRKMEALTIVSDWTDSELIFEIMNGAPKSWTTHIDTSRIVTWEDFLDKIAWHEEDLLGKDSSHNSDIQRQLHQMQSTLKRLEGNRHSRPSARSHLAGSKPVGWHQNNPPPKYPKDDSTVSKGKTPKDKKARPCRHCGSMMHWDRDCKHAKKNSRFVRSHMAQADDDEWEAQEAYEDLCDEAYLDETEYDTEGEESVSEEEQDFHKPLQSLAVSTSSAKPSSGSQEEQHGLEGTTVSQGTNSADQGSKESDSSVFSGYVQPKLPTRKSFNKKLKMASSHTATAKNGEEITLKRLMSRPPGTAFFGSKATIIKGWLQTSNGPKKRITFDSGSEITLINESILKTLDPSPRVRIGQKLKLIQVTGNSSLSQYISLPIIFDTEQGLVKMIVEAYIVPNMNTPFILGTDFASQYQLSLIRNGDGTRIVFGDTGRSIPVEESDSSPRIDQQGNTFMVEVAQGFIKNSEKIKISKKAYKKRLQHRKLPPNTVKVKVYETVTIPAHTIKLIKVKTTWKEGQASGFMDRSFNSHRQEEHLFAITDCLIDRNNPKIQVSNLSEHPLRLQGGEILGYMHDPNEYLAKEKDITKEEKDSIIKYATLVQAMVQRKAEEKPTAQEEELMKSPEGGPKTAEVPDPEPVPSDRFLQEVNFSEHLTPNQRAKLEKVLRKYELAFGLDGRLGTHNTQLEIRLRPGTKEISITPYHASPAKREVIDKQIEEWLKLGVIEPSKSAWGFPVIVVYRNSKPRLCVDYRRLNEVAIPDEYPLPKQTDILHALEGSQWLTTLDALAGFTQLTIKEEDREKLAFRCHNGHWQPTKLLFGYRNGPAEFQRVMNRILSRFLWQFALVYIDDIVIYSVEFEDHCNHLDQVLGAIEEAEITLSPKKCHIGYQSLLLLGQKVSRLGLSTHKEKVDAILELEPPKNVPTLQTFLGMMTYFSSYIPFYSWIVAPLFKLLKKGTAWSWEEKEQQAFELAKEALASAPVMAYPIIGKPYRLYTDACDYGLGGILQQVQSIKIKDLKGTKAYKYLRGEYDKGNPVPRMTIPASKQRDDVTGGDTWDKQDFEETTVQVEQVIAYWSRILKEAERNYSPTERKALALKEALVKFQVYLEGAEFVAITDHAALTWSKTYNNVNRRLMTWGLVFSAYPGMQIVHRAGRVHDNADPISRLRRRTPYHTSPLADQSTPLKLNMEEDPLRNLYKEINERFEEKLLRVASAFTQSYKIGNSQKPIKKWIPTPAEAISYQTTTSYSVEISINSEEITRFIEAYKKDSHFKQVMEEFKSHHNPLNPPFHQYQIGDNGLIYFIDSQEKYWPCVPRDLQVDILKENHDNLNQGAHAGYAKTYHRIASVYYWPKMARSIQKYVHTCDICQKAGHRRHGPRGFLQPLPIPQQPFEVVSMDFIMDLPPSNNYNAILVIVDKLTKYGHFIPCTTQIDEVQTAQLFHDHIWCHYGLPRQVITDRDARWTGAFWGHLVSMLGIRRALTTAHHPQSDGQTEILNQTTEVAIRVFTNPAKDNWSVHTSTQQTPAFLLCGFQPLTSADLLALTSENIPRPAQESQTAEEFKESMELAQSLAKDALKVAQNYQQKYYNSDKTHVTFEPGDLVLINPHSLNLLKHQSGKGNKLNMRYEGPFEVMESISPVAYRIRLPASYRIHPIINIAHLESYKASPPEFGSQPTQNIPREDFQQMPEYEVERIVEERTIKKGNKRIRQYKIRWLGYSSEHDRWRTEKELRNAPEVIKEWKRTSGSTIHPNHKKKKEF